MSSDLTQPAPMRHIQAMSVMQPIFASAYRQLTPVERAFVDQCVEQLESGARGAGERVDRALHRPIPADIVERSRGMLDRALVRAAISERLSAIATEQELNPGRVLKEVMALSMSNIGNYITPDASGTPTFDLTHCTPEQLAAIKTLKIRTTGDGFGPKDKVEMEVTLHPKLDALKIIMQYMGMLADENGHWAAHAPAPADALPAGATVAQAGDRYAAMLGE